MLPKADVFNKRDCNFLFNMTSGAPWNKMYLMSFLKRNNLQFMEIVVCNDLFMTYSALLSAGRIAAIHERFTFYRIHNKNSLQNRKENHVCEIIRALKAVDDFINTHDCEQAIIRSYQNYLLSLTYYLIYSFESIEARQKMYEYYCSCRYIVSMSYTDVFFFNQLIWMEMKQLLLDGNPNENDQIKISVIVPVYNDEKTIAACLTSLAKQNLDNIEFIIVDDCSTDNTYKIVSDYAKWDSRFIVLKHDMNLSAFQARKDGVLIACGKYIMFVDADDSLAEGACKKLWELEQIEHVDILHFSTDVIALIDDKKQIEKYKKLINPKNEYLTGKDVFSSFVDRNFEGHLWNKIFYRELAAFALSKTEDSILPKGQDKYFYWIMAYYAESYKGCPDLTLYNYYYGIGTEGRCEYKLSEFEVFCKQAWTEKAISSFMQENSSLENNETILSKSRSNLIRHTVKQIEKLSKGDRTEAVKLMLSYWDAIGDKSEIVAALCDEYKDRKEELIGILEPLKTNKPKEIKTIGTYYHIFNNGGIQRVLARLMKIWINEGYEVVFFTDYDACEEDYELPEGVQRITLAMNGNSAQRNYKDRGASLEAFIREYKIDIMVYHEYFGRSMLWDLILSKFLNVPFVIYYHNVFSKFIATYEDAFFTIPQAAKIADAVIALSEVDKIFWNAFNCNVFTVKNPLVFDLNETASSSLKNNMIVWVGRLDELHKRFMEPIDIMKLLLQKVPSAKLMIIGRDADSSNYNRLKSRIAKLHLEDSVILCGFQKDVAPFYEMASVYLMTSTFEGYPMTLIEALSFGLPVVMYDLPYLTLVDGNDGIISIDQGDRETMAQAIEMLLLDIEYRKSVGRAARTYIKRMYANNDVNKEWDEVFNSLLDKRDSVKTVNKTNILVKTLVEHFKISYENNQRELSRYKKIVEQQGKNNVEKLMDINTVNEQSENAEADYYRYLLDETRNSFTYKIGRAITLFPRWIRHILFQKPM